MQMNTGGLPVQLIEDDNENGASSKKRLGRVHIYYQFFIYLKVVSV